MTDAPLNLEFSALDVQISIEFGGLNLPFIEVFPADALEPRVVLQGHEGWTSQSAFRLVLVQQLLHQLSGLLVLQRTRILQLQVQNLFVYLQWIFAFLSEGDVAAHKLEHIDSEGVKTHCEGVPLSDNDLRGHVMRSTDQGESFGGHYVSSFDHLGSHQVDQFEKALNVDHEIFGFEVAHDDSLSGQVLENQYHGGDIELGVFGAEQSDFPDAIVEFFALYEFNERVEVVFVLKAFVVFHDEGVIEAFKEVFFLRDILEKRVFFDLLLAVALQHIQFLFFQLIQTSDQQDRTELSLLQLLQQDQLIEPVDQLVSLLYLLMELFSLLFFIFFHHCVHEPSDDLLDDVGLDFRDDPIGFHDDVVLIPSLGFVLEKELFPVDLGPHCDGVDVFIFFESALNDDDNLLVVDILSVFLDNHISCFVAVDLHQIQDLLDLLLRKFGKVSAFLDGPLHKVPEGHHEDLVSQHFAQSLPSQDQTGHVFFCLHRHLPDSVVEQSLLSERISLLEFGHQFVPLVNRSSSLLDDVERRPWVSLVDDHLALHVLLGNQGSSNGILVVVGKTAEETYIFHEFLILLVLLNDDFLNGLPKGIPVDGPQRTVLACFDRESSWGLVEESNLPESISHSQCLFDLVVGDDLHHPLLDYEETHGFRGFSEDERV